MIFSLETRIFRSMSNEYVITIANLCRCCLNFSRINVQTLGEKEKWVNYKNLYYMFFHVMHCNPMIDEFIHQPILSCNKINLILE
jgi:hypothetical protein